MSRCKKAPPRPIFSASTSTSSHSQSARSSVAGAGKVLGGSGRSIGSGALGTGRMGESQGSYAQKLAGMSVKELKQFALDRSLDVRQCLEKSDIVSCILPLHLLFNLHHTPPRARALLSLLCTNTRTQSNALTHTPANTPTHRSMCSCALPASLWAVRGEEEESGWGKVNLHTCSTMLDGQQRLQGFLEGGCPVPCVGVVSRSIGEQCVAVCCSLLQRVAACCSVLQ